ncbi:MAG TPA: MFS transporter [Anaeromyxobacteraceae bacterium]|nr:MFS transporter [Anaeromyxobacteraceae bacterium]
MRAALLGRLVAVRPGERTALFWSFAYFFSLLSGYYLLRPVREEMGIRGGVENLPWAFTATFASMLVAVPLFSWLVARVPRARAIPIVYRFFLVHLLVFWILLRSGAGHGLVARAFFVWVSVYNLFVVSVFWAYMADVWESSQAKRLFGFVAAGGSAGALLGPLLAAGLVRPLGVPALLLVSAGLLEVAARCAGRLGRWARQARPGDAGAGAALGGGPFAGVAEVLRSRYLAALAAQMLLFTASGTILYFQQARLVSSLLHDSAARTRLFAGIDLAVNLASLLTQSLLTGTVLTRLGLGFALAIHPVLAASGLLAIAAWPSLALVTGVQALRRAVHYGLERPAREALYTVVPREEKYKAKSFIDTVVYRGGDALSAWTWTGISALGPGLAGAALAATPLAVAWLLVARYLHRRHAALETTPG